jgi:hypothetical protein
MSVASGEIKQKIHNEYIAAESSYAEWINDWNKPSPSGRSGANPSPFYYYHLISSTLNGLWGDLIRIACEANDYGILIAELKWLNTNCPERGRDYDFSRTILSNPNISSDHIKICSRAFVIGFIKGDFNCDVIADDDGGNLVRINRDLASMTKSLCLSVMLIPAMRYLKYSYEKYSYECIYEMEHSKWITLATYMQTKGKGMEANTIASMLIANELYEERPVAEYTESAEDHE